jgi:ATP-binding protein involved in chromosome partitioning
VAQEDDPLAVLKASAAGERIRSQRLSGGVATIVADATGLDGAGREQLERDLRSAAIAIAGVAEARIALTAEQPARKLIAIGSGKGGVGKSTVAANLAVALARSGRKVGLIDADIYGPSQPTLLGSAQKPTAENDRLVPVEAHGLQFLSLGQLVSPGHALAWRGPMATGALSRLVEADWGDAELLLVDLPPGTGDVQLSLIQKSRPAGALVVSTPQDLSLIDARRAIDLFRKMDVPVLGIIENMAGYLCPHCGQGSDPFGSGGAEAAAEEMGVEFLGRLPLSLAIREASDAGVPPALGEGAAGGAFAALAQRVVAALDTAAR